METTISIMLQWFILLLCTLALSGVVSATGVLFVKPTNDTLCPQQPCHTLEHYAQSWQLYLTSNTVVQFLPGEHVLEGDWNELKVESISNLTLIGSDSVIYNSSPLGIPIATSRISCRRSKTLFSFYNVTELFIERLMFSECGGGEATLILYEMSNLVFDSVTIQNSTGSGLIGHNLRESLVSRSAFMFNQVTETIPYNIYFTYHTCSEVIENFTLNITSSRILFGKATTEAIYPDPRGLSLNVDETCYNVKVHIHNTILKENMLGNMILVLNGFSQNIDVAITDSHFEGGYAGFGGGLFIETFSSGSQIPQHVQSNHVYINNTKFVGNHAIHGGAIAVFPNTGTKVYINGSKFHNNTAQDGGHVSIILTPITCATANTTTAINNSLFEAGRATGSGGGVVLQGTFSNEYQCKNHISISNTKFVGNHAENYGGAVAQWGYIGTELYIVKSEFYNNTASQIGGHLSLQLLSDYALFVVVNDSHFQSGEAHAGGGISVLLDAADSCTSVSSTIHSSVYILNSIFYQNVADRGGGGIAIQLLNQSCIAANVLIHNVSFSKNNATMNGGNIYLANLCTAGNSITISRSIVEYGNSSMYGGGMGFITGAFNTCISSMVSLKPTIVNIVDSTVQYNTAIDGGGLNILFQRFCCNVEMNITNVTFFNNKADKAKVTFNGANIKTTNGGNIFIYDSAGLWFNQSVRIHNCLIEGGEAEVGGGIAVKHDVSQQRSLKMEWLSISSTQFVCNRASLENGGASSLQVVGNYSRPQQPLTLGNTKKLTITDTTFDGTCDNSTNVLIDGFSVLPIVNNVVFINVSFRGYSTNLSSPLSTFHSQQLFDEHLILNTGHSGVFASLFQNSAGVMLYFISNATFIDCEFFGSTIDSALTATGSNVFFGGNITFRDNVATYGGGDCLYLITLSCISDRTHTSYSLTTMPHIQEVLFMCSQISLHLAI